MGQTKHAILPEPSLEEAARQAFALDIRRHMATRVAPSCQTAYEVHSKKPFVDANGREPSSRAEARRAMADNTYYQMFSAMQRNVQELTWDAVIDTVERQADDLATRAKTVSGSAGGSLRIDDAFEPPSYLTGYDIHLQPGAYHMTRSSEDVAAGALYETGTYLYSMGQLGPDTDYLGKAVIQHYKSRFPDKTPKRILDMGCTVGHSTMAWAKEFPDAEVHGIDVGQALLRYAHARAEDLNIPIHFSQQNAEHTDFEDGSFDVVVSHIMMHETSTGAVPAIFEESRRLLAPGGVMLHMDIPRLAGVPPVQAFIMAWEVYNNNETFGGTYREMDVEAEALKAGWPADQVALEFAEHFMPPKIRNYTPVKVTWPTVVGWK